MTVSVFGEETDAWIFERAHVSEDRVALYTVCSGRSGMGKWTLAKAALAAG